MRNILFSAALSMLATAGAAHATVSLDAALTPLAPITGDVTIVSLAGVVGPSAATITTPSYSIVFSVAAGQGMVRGASADNYAVPVAGQSGGAVTYLTGDYGSATTTNRADAGDYFSTGGTGSSITIQFTTLQNSLQLLWGSIDAGNRLELLAADGTVLDTVTGTTVQDLTAGFTSNGAQSFGGSAYVSVVDITPFKSVRFSSIDPSFEFTGVATLAAIQAVPEPVSLALLGSALVMTGLVRRRRSV